MRLGEQRRETAVAYSLGAIGLIRGIAMVYGVEPLTAWARKHHESGVHIATHAPTEYRDNLIPLPIVTELGSVALQETQLVA
jgi:hypothetical protein